MKNATASHWWHRLRHSILAAGAAASLAACADEGPAGPDRRITLPTGGAESRAADLGTCDALRAPAGSKLAYHVYAEGVQIYHWNGSSWVFDAPSATLSADPQGRSVVGTHYAGPKWESNSGGIVTGTAIDRCTPNPDAIAWLTLRGVATGPGVFHRVTFIQRVNTVGGTAPTYSGSVVGEIVRVPYTAEYFFYRDK